MKQKLIYSIALMTAACAGFADWSLEFDFEDGLPENVFQANNRELSTNFADTLNGRLRVNHGDLLEQTSNLWVMLPLSADLKAASAAAGGPVTVYFEMIHPSIDGQRAIVDVAWGLSNVDPDTILEDRYNAFNAMMRIDSGDLNFELRDGGGYVEISQLETDTVYSVWMVLDYTLNFMEVYIQGGQYTAQTNIGLVAFRVDPGPEQTVDYMAFGLSDGNSVDGAKGIDFFLFDNVAIDTAAQNLTMPTSGATWAGYPVDSLGYVDTGAWMGYINVNFAPIIWSVSLNAWMYMPEASVGNGGAWTYIYNF